MRKRLLTSFLALILVLALVMPALAGSLLFYPKFKAWDDDGNLLDSGKLYTYIAGTSTNKATYSDRACTTPNTNPVVLDAQGEATVYLNGLYKLVLKNSDDSETLWTMDNVQGDVQGNYTFYPDPTETDQGTVGAGNGLYDILAALGTAKKATIVFTHSGAANTTSYTVSTTYDAKAYDNVEIRFEEGAQLSVDVGKTLTLYCPSKIKAGLKQQIMSGSGTLAFDTPGEQSIGWWGAVGDGSTDDNAEFQAAIDCAEATHVANVVRNSYLHAGSTVIIPGGVHIVTGLTVTAQIMIRGLGNQNSYVKSDTDAIIFDCDAADTVNYQPFVFRDFAIKGDPSLTSQTGIDSVLHCRLENMVISWCGGHGFKSTNGNSNEILSCKIQNNGGYGIYLTGTSNTACQIIGNIIRENKIGIYIVPSSGTITTGLIADNVIESNLSVEGWRYSNSKIGAAARPGVGIWLADVAQMKFINNSFENQLVDIYGAEDVSHNIFENNWHGASNGVPGDYDGNSGPSRKRQDVTIDGGSGNQFINCRFERPVKPAATATADWGCTYSATTGTITDVTDGFGSLTHMASVTLTAGDVAAMSLVAGSWIHITDITGTVGTDSSYGLNDHSFQVLAISGQVLAIEPTDLTGLTYTSGGTVSIATTWPHEYEHIKPGTRAIIQDCIWQSPSGVNEQIILPYVQQHHTTNISTEKAGAVTNYRNSGPQNMVWGGMRTVTNMWHGYYWKYFDHSAIDATHQHYARSGYDHHFTYQLTDVGGEPSGSAVEAFVIGPNGKSHTDQAITATGAVSITVPGSTVNTTGGGYAITLADGHYIGQIKAIRMSADGGVGELTVAHHETDTNEVFDFDDAGDTLTLVWSGALWITLNNYGVTVP